MWADKLLVAIGLTIGFAFQLIAGAVILLTIAAGVYEFVTLF